MDKQELYVLETVGKNYAIKKKKMATISNCLSISNADIYNDVKNFKKKYTDIPKENANFRKKTTYKKLLFAKNENDLFKIMRTHSKKNNCSVCMHGEYETTNSMVVILDDKPIVYFTGCPNPCESQYIKYVFGNNLIYPIVDEKNQEDCRFWKDKTYKINL